MAEHNHYGHRSRLRERVAQEGLEHFHDYQVLEYVLSFVIPYKDTNDLAHELIDKFGSLAGVFEADAKELMTVKGMGEVSATFISDFLKIYNRYERCKLAKRTQLISPQDTYDYFRGLFTGKLVEELYIVALSPKSKILKVQRISSGSNTEAKVTIRDITDLMSSLKVANIIVAHNHPDGDVKPSEEDNKFTKALVTTLSINGCHLIDHIIMSNKKFYSYRQSGLIDKYKGEIAYLLEGKTVAQPEAFYGVKNDKKR
ncbi:MAG: DNA repair protein RadC [Clostridiales bacterium]|nr:DNA repair protein RadC [Clostridiales bacterium]